MAEESLFVCKRKKFACLHCVSFGYVAQTPPKLEVIGIYFLMDKWEGLEADTFLRY
jgi:hypothetical protein